MQDLNVVALQSDLAWEDRETNLKNFDQVLEKVESDQDLIILPEMFNTAFSMKPEYFSEPEDGPTLQWVKEKAVTYQAVLIASWMVEENGAYYNRLFVVRPNGDFQTYDKRHLFRMGNENEHFSAGEKQLIVDIKGWKVKPLVCYDLRFPVWAKNTYTDGQYDFDLLVYIANWPAARSKPWRTLLEARAIENQSCVIGVNRVGKDEVGNDYSGHSLILNAKGEIQTSLKEREEGIVYSSLSFQELSDFRNKFTVGLDWDRFSIEK